MARVARNMTYNDKQKVLAKLNWETGFEYIITGSDFPEYLDPKFRALVSKFKQAWEDLEEFLGPYDENREEDSLD